MDTKQHQAPPPERDASLQSSTSASNAKRQSQWISYLPGLSVTLAGAAAAWLISQLIPGISPLLIAILVGALWRNLIRVPRTLSPGITFSSKKLLRAGIILLGLQLSLSSILGLGPGVLLVVVASVAVTFGVTLWIGRLMGISLTQRLLIASGVSICGAAAVAAAENATDAKEEETATAIGLVVLFGTLMIPAVPFLGSLLGLDAESTGMWIGASTHEVAQVVAAGSAVGGGALAVAVTVKLARVLTLAPMIAGISLYMRKTGAVSGGKRPPIVPFFIVGFLAAVLLRSSGFLPDPVLAAGQVLQTILLAAAMFALGLGLDLKGLIRVGGRPVLLGLGATVLILGVALAGTLLFPPL